MRDEWNSRREKGDTASILDDIVFEVELIKQIEVNIDYILMLVKKYYDSNCEDKEILVTIRKAVNASPHLRSKKELIENFIASVSDGEQIVSEWHDFVAQQREKDLSVIIEEENLKEEETRKFLENCFQDGEIKTIGTDIDKILPPISRFGGKRAMKKQAVIEKLRQFFEKYFGIGGPTSFAKLDDE